MGQQLSDGKTGGSNLSLTYEKQKSQDSNTKEYTLFSNVMSSYKGEIDEKSSITTFHSTISKFSENSDFFDFSKLERLKKNLGNYEKIDNIKESHKSLILYRFEWNEGGSQVFIVSAYTNWNLRNQMEKLDNGPFKTKLVIINKFNLS